MVGEIGIDPKYFLYEMSLDEMTCTRNGYENKVREQWNQVRTISYYSCLADLKEPEKPLFVFPWEKPNEVTSTRERFDELNELIK